MELKSWKAVASVIMGMTSFMTFQGVGVDASTVVSRNTGFVQASNGHFTLNGHPFYFAGANNYYLNYDSNAMIDDVLTKAQKMGLKVVRMWGFLDGVTENGDISMQPTLGHYELSGFERMDYAVAEAQKLGLKLIITLVNNGSNFGGMDQYVKWVEGSSGSHDDFYTNPKIIKAYENYVKYLITRKNSITGVEYRNDPTIMAWDLANEPEDKSDPTGKTLTKWASQVSSFIHQIDPHHLIALGDEGWFSANDPQKSVDPATYTQKNGVNWDAILKLPYISYGTYHLYPETWGSTATWGNQWIAAHIKAANSAGKPAVLEEYGEQDTNAQPSVYQSWINTVLKNHGAGEMFWMLSGNMDNGKPYPNYDGYGVYYPSKLADVLSNGALQMSRLTSDQQPVVIKHKALNQTTSAPAATAAGLTTFENFDEYTNNTALQSNYQFNGDPTTIFLNQQYVKSAANSLQVNYTLGSNGYCGVEETIQDLDWTGFKGIQFWVKSDNTGHTVSLQFETKGGQYWEDDQIPVQPTTQWQLVQVPFSDFAPPSWDSGNTGILNLGDIVQFSLYFGGPKGKGTMYFDTFQVYSS